MAVGIALHRKAAFDRCAACFDNLGTTVFVVSATHHRRPEPVEGRLSV
jgi:hypothetical protein